jgi:transposase-like protein DUF772
MVEEELEDAGDALRAIGMFSHISAERRVPKDHPLRAIRAMVDTALKELRPRLDGLYARGGRPSIAPERLLRALLLQVLYSIRSERMPMEQLDYNLLFRWFVGLSMDDPIWDATCSSRTASGCSPAKWRKAFSNKWWRRRARKVCFRLSTSLSTAP